MVWNFVSGALLGHVYILGDGTRVRLRLARTSDFAAIRRLLVEAGVGGSDLEPGRLVHFDPRRRYVVCATALVDSSERLLGLGSIRLGGDDPDLLVVADASPAELRGLLQTLLVDAATDSPRAA